MKNEQIFKNDELIPLLIKYVKVNKVVFPIERVKYLFNGEVVDLLKDCINNHSIYNPNYDIVSKITRFANICGEQPNCERCKLRNYCHYNKKYDVNI